MKIWEELLTEGYLMIWVHFCEQMIDKLSKLANITITWREKVIEYFFLPTWSNSATVAGKFGVVPLIANWCWRYLCCKDGLGSCAGYCLLESWVAELVLEKSDLKAVNMEKYINNGYFEMY